eukprot:338531-Alexandrium_andersonii.AAC.1
MSHEPGIPMPPISAGRGGEGRGVDVASAAQAYGCPEQRRATDKREPTAPCATMCSLWTRGLGAPVQEPSPISL